VAAAQALPHASVRCHYLDLYHADEARESVGVAPPNLAIECSADFSAGPFNLVVLPFSASGEAELVRDLLQAGHEALDIGGQLVAATDNRRDSWLHQQMFELFGSVRPREGAGGMAYLARKERPLKKLKNFACEFAFRDRGRLIRAFSRPGVFSHRHIDPGARQLIDALQIEPGERMLEIGCGSGVVSLAAAFRAEGVRVHAVDSHTRAVACTAHGAELNDLANITTELNAHGDYAGQGTYQLALANPPYYANFRIAEFFLAAAQAALQPGGRLLLVTKLPNWYAEHLCEWFEEPAIEQSKQYYIVSGRRPDWGDGT
jgi:16S rRNA (guanine1207-N2)-methyltransferase